MRYRGIHMIYITASSSGTILYKEFNNYTPINTPIFHRGKRIPHEMMIESYRDAKSVITGDT